MIFVPNIKIVIDRRNRLYFVVQFFIGPGSELYILVPPPD
ncbi:hypothetical protein M2408_003854 [Sphingobacterium sp. BIGb0165]|nr:hypothetical protein [Sphingobacterium sp. BIGb0165]